ncbi:MAG: hypothetical protein IJL71_04845, partial [Oscillospiraceae bacterium]|nr:hypothetical protein [Oscillospiraceae bacterium]
YDEFAKRALQIADSVCFKAALAFICAFLAVMFAVTVFRAEPVTTAEMIFLGRILVFAIPALFVLRFVLFYVIDKKGMVD